jgi:lysophospholipid acyltransferase (LPLAT)-like uncharacterized protein
MRDLHYEAAGVVGAGAVGALFLTTKVRRTGVEHFEQFRRRSSPVIFVFWHGQLLPLVHYHRHEGIVVLVSEHGDGEYIARVIERNGFGTVRGSSTRGGTTGLRGLVRAARAGRDLAITPDGPRGPRGAFKPGALAAARLTGLPLVPLAVASSSGWRLSSWDGFLVPKPLSTVRIEYLAPRFVSRSASRSELETMAAQIGADLHAATARMEGEPAEVGATP